MVDTHSMTASWPSGEQGPTDSLLHSELSRLRAHLERHHGELGGPSASMGDVAQEAAARVLEKKEELRFESRGAFRAYLLRTAKRILVDRWRRRDRKQPLEAMDSLASWLPAGPPIEIPDGRTEDLLKSLQSIRSLPVAPLRREARRSPGGSVVHRGSCWLDHGRLPSPRDGDPFPFFAGGS